MMAAWKQGAPGEQPPAVFVIFGATGDLAKRKLFPAFYSLFKDGLLSKRFAVVGVSRQQKSDVDFQEHVFQSLKQYSRDEVTDCDEWEQFKKHFAYYPLDVNDKSHFAGLKTRLDELDKQFDIPGNRLFYLAMAPDFFGPVALNLKGQGLTQTDGWKRLIIEKPFGHDLESAQLLNKQLCEVFSEEEIFRIDHYLGKEMVQNIEVIRFANSLFEPVWNNRHIANIQITSSETVGVEERAGYYETSGALRDMVQNHMLQMVMMMAMEPPSRLKTEAIRDEKVKVLRSLRRFTAEEVKENVIRGQYGAGENQGKPVVAYREEPGVKPDSTTETFVAAKLYIDNFRWAGVPFYIRTGKRMERKSTEIVVEFKEMPKHLYFNQQGDLGPNLLVIRVNPTEGMHLQLNAKQPGTEGGVVPIVMQFSQHADDGMPEAYERLIYDCLHGDSTFFTRWDEVSLAWKFVDIIADTWAEEANSFPNYASGTWGPQEADALLKRDGFHWWPVSGQLHEAPGMNVKPIVQQAVEVPRG